MNDEKPIASVTEEILVLESSKQKTREEELIDEINILERQLECSAEKLRENENNVIADLIIALNDQMLGCPLDSIYVLSKNDGVKFHGAAINLFNAFNRIGVRTFGEELIGTKKKLSELKGRNRCDNKRGLSDTVTVVAPGYMYKGIPILPIRIKHEE